MNPIVPGHAWLKFSGQASITPASSSNNESAAMKIESSNALAATRAAAAGGEVRKADATAAPNDAKGDSAVLASRAQTNAPPPFDSQRVAELRAQVAEGRYQPSGERIADAMIALEADLVGRSR